MAQWVKVPAATSDDLLHPRDPHAGEIHSCFDFHLTDVTHEIINVILKLFEENKLMIKLEVRH